MSKPFPVPVRAFEDSSPDLAALKDRQILSGVQRNTSTCATVNGHGNIANIRGTGHSGIWNLKSKSGS